MEALMNPRSSPLKLTPEDRLIRRWKILGLIVTATPRHEPDSANRGIETGFSAALADRRPAH
jgi:hypothetical protein